MDKIEQIKELTKELLQHCHSYYDLDAPTISDAEYDKMYDKLKSLEDETDFYLANSPTHKVQGDVLPFLKKIKHSVPMLSADKSTNINDVKKFVNGRTVCVSYKLDGATVVLKYFNGKFVQGLSRGSGIEGEDITHTSKMMKNIPIEIPYKGYLEVRGEALIPWEYYNEMNDGSLGHPRNIASGGLRQLDANEAAKRNICFYAFTLVNWEEVYKNTDVIPLKSHTLNFLSRNGFSVVPHYIVPACDSNGKTLEETIKKLDRETYENPTDGWCFEFENLAYGDSLGSTGHHDRRLFALKPEREIVETTLIDIDWTMGKTGILTPTAIMNSVEIDNTVVERASLHNISIMNSLNLSINCGVKLYKANMIIPQIDSCFCDGDIPIEIPNVCPICGGQTKIVKENDSEILMCTNSMCSGKLLGKLVHAASKKALNIDGLSEATISFLIDKGWVSSITDIYHLKNHKDEWEKCNGFGKTSVNNILKSIEKSRNITLDKFITALSIPNIGSTASKAIANHFNGSHYDFVQALETGYDFTQLNDFGEIMNQSLHDWWKSKDKMVELLPLEMNFEEPEISTQEQSLAGVKFCITGSFSKPRGEFQKALEARGAKFVSSVSKNLDVLFVGDKAGSKLTKAQQLGIKVANEEELIKMINGGNTL